MRIKTTISVAMITLGIWICFPLTGRAADAALENMRSTVGNSKADLENYRKLLVEFEKAKLKAKDQEGATAAKLEIIKLDRELAAMDGGSSRRFSRSEAATDGDNADKAAAAKTVADKAASVKAATEKADADKTAAALAAAKKAAAEKAAAEKAATEKAATEKAAAQKAAAEKAAAQKAAAEKAAAEKAAAEKAAAEKAAAEKAAAEKAAAEKAAAEKAAAEKAAAEKAAAEKAAAQKAATDKAAAAMAAVEEAAAMKPTDEAQKIADKRSQLRQLIAQGSEKLNSGDVQGAREVKAKVNEIQEELTRLGAPAGSANNGKTAVVSDLALATAAPAPEPTPAAASAPAPATPPPAAAPAPQSLAQILRSPQTHVSSVQGLAGAQNYSQNNVYNFDLDRIGPTATLSYYATGRRSKDTSGNIWLVTPGGRRERVAQWKSGQFEVTSSEVSSYTKLKPATVDISGLVKGPGAYQIEFEWTDGIAPLVIYRVEISS